MTVYNSCHSRAVQMLDIYSSLGEACVACVFIDHILVAICKEVTMIQTVVEVEN